MLSSMLLMLWWCEGKGVAGEHREGEGGGAGGAGRAGGAGGDAVVRGIEGVRVSFELDGKETTTK